MTKHPNCILKLENSSKLSLSITECIKMCLSGIDISPWWEFSSFQQPMETAVCCCSVNCVLSNQEITTSASQRFAPPSRPRICFGPFFNSRLSLTMYFTMLVAVICEGGHLPAVGVQTGTLSPPRRAHPAALRSHVPCPETLRESTPHDHQAAGALQRISYEVGHKTLISNLHV